MSKHTIENGQLTIQVNEKGAELASVIKKSNGKEYLWQADPTYWGRHAPVLFPFVGKLKDNTYSYEGDSYQMGQHGFARDQQFELMKTTENSITFVLQSSKDTHAIYPFDFELEIGYELKGDTLQISYQVINKGAKEMYFSVGAHPAFNCPFDEGDAREDYALLFNHEEKLPSYLLENGNFNAQTKEIFDKDGLINISKTLFDDDALVFKDFKSTSASLVKKSNNEPYLTVAFKGFPYLGIWSKNQDSPFVCIEPWYGLADSTTHDGNIESKEGIQKLSPLEKFYCEHAIMVH